MNAPASEQDNSETDRIARRFVTARRQLRALPDYPGSFPQSLNAAYAIQDAAIQAYGAPVLGWKLGRINPPLDEAHGANRFAGPVFAVSFAEQSGDADMVMPIFAEGFAAGEAEFVALLAHDQDVEKSHYSLDEAAAMIGALHAGIEVAGSPFPGINSHGPAVTISDFGNNSGLLIGPAFADWQASGFLQWSIRSEIDGQPVGQAMAASMLDGPVGAVRFLLEHMARRGTALRKGQWISTGAVTGVHQIRPGQRFSAHFGDRASLSCRMVAARAE